MKANRKLIYIFIIYIPILVNLFTNIGSMEESTQESLFLTSPNEIKLYIFELLIKNIIENNSIFEPYNNVKETIDNITAVNKEFNNFKSYLIRFSKKYTQKHFAATYINWPQEEMDIQFKNILASIDTDNRRELEGINNIKELEIEAAKLIIAGANPNLTIDHNIFLRNNSLLMIIARTGKFKNLMKLLIQYSANINAQTDYGYTALMHATINKRKNIAKLLINAGANVNAKDSNGDTSLIQAARYGYTSIAKLLINTGANVNAKDNYGFTALMRALCNNYENIVKLLIDANVNINAQNIDGDTALMLWTVTGKYNNYTNIAELLINSGANVNIRNNDGYNALLLSVKYNHKDAFTLLADAKAHINIKDKYGNTALIWAAQADYKDMVELLINAGANINEQNNCGNTALTLAIRYGLIDIVKLLKAAMFKNNQNN